ncbi:hypothetical protein [Caudoviricetes sp.]|nr:hypothetical protein [Caudoviricetes sp.]
MPSRVTVLIEHNHYAFRVAKDTGVSIKKINQPKP